MLREYCVAKGIAYEECGKLVVARTQDEVAGLDRLQDRATTAGVPGIERLDLAAMRHLEPNAVGVAAVHSPTTAITDYSAISRALRLDVEAAGGSMRCGIRVDAITETASGVRVGGSDESRVFDRAVLCAGLQSDRVARLSGAPDDPRIVPFRGEYFELSPRAAGLVNGLVYPVPDPRYPFLGVHFTRRVDGRVDVGPNAVLALAREGYRWRDVDLRDLVRFTAWPGAWRLGRAHWRTGLQEIVGSVSRKAFADRARSYVPALRTDDLVPMPSGVRAQAVDRRGALLDDFVIQRHGRVVAVRNAPSPAATASLAIAERICESLTVG